MGHQTNAYLNKLPGVSPFFDLCSLLYGLDTQDVWFDDWDSQTI